MIPHLRHLPPSGTSHSDDMSSQSCSPIQHRILALHLSLHLSLHALVPAIPPCTRARPGT